MNRKPHSLDISCSYQIVGKKTKKRLGKSSLAGYIELGEGKTKIILPMRSFVKNFLDTLHDILAGENTNDCTKIATASIAQSVSITKKAGILLGNGIWGSPPAITSTNLSALVSGAAYLEYKGHSFIAPYAPSNTEIKAQITRLITNASSAPWTITEVGLKNKKTASTASNAGTRLVTLDAVQENFAAVSDKLVALAFSIARTSENGGAVLNLMRLFYNLYLQGDANYSTFLPRVGTVSLSHANASATSPLVVDGASGKFWGILVGKYAEGVGTGETDSSEFGEPPTVENPVTTPDDYIFAENVTSLSYGANTVTAVTISGRKASFTVSRDITNNTTSTVYLNRIGLATKGATADPSALQDDQIYLMINRSVANIALIPNQTIRVEYKFEIEA